MRCAERLALVLVLSLGVVAGCGWDKEEPPENKGKATPEAQTEGKSLAELVAMVVKRADEAAAKRDWHVAAYAYGVAACYQPSDQSILDKRQQVAGEAEDSPLEMTLEQIKWLRPIISKLIEDRDLGTFDKFPAPGESTELADLRILLDKRIVTTFLRANVSSTDLSGRMEAFMGKPSLTADEVVAAYGKPAVDKSGKGGRVMTYSRVRLLADAKGRLLAVFFSPS